MGCGPSSAETLCLFGARNLYLAAIEHSILAPGPNRRLSSALPAGLLDPESITCQLILVINLFLGNLLSTLFIAVEFSNLAVLSELLLAKVKSCAWLAILLRLFLLLRSYAHICVVLGHLLLQEFLH
jgi:hypothetical protein